MSKTSEFPSVDDQTKFTPAEKTAYLNGAMCLSSGPKGGGTVTANIPIDDLKPDMSLYYTKTETDNAFVSQTGYVATDNNYTTAEKKQLAGLTPIRRLGESASVIGQYNVLKVHVTQAGYFYVDLDAQTPGGYPTPATIKLCIFTPVSPLESGARSACKFTALIIGNKAAYDNILPYPVLYVKQNTSSDYIVYVILKVKNDSSVTDYGVSDMPSVRWTIWRDERYNGSGQHLDYQFMLGVISDPDYSGSTMMEWDQVNFIDAANITNVTPDWNAAAGTAAEILNKPTIPTASTLAGDGLEEASGKLKVVTKVPDPGDDEHRGHVLTVSNTDEVVWDEVSGSQPTYGVGLEYNQTTNTLKFSYLGSGGLTYEHGPDETRGMKVKAGVGINVDDKGVGIDTTQANEGDVLTYHKNGSVDEVVWMAPGGGGGGGLPDASSLANAESSYHDKLSEDTDTFTVNKDYEMRYSFIPTEMKDDGSIRTYKIKWFVKAGSGGFETAAIGSGSFT